MRYVNRFVIEYGTTQNGVTATELEESIETFRDIDSWILLGEAGAGKSTVMQEEAKEAKGYFISIAEFLTADVQTYPEWQGQLLFLDALDEVNLDGPNSLYKIKQQLRKFNCNRFRIACRASDWYDTTYSKILQEFLQDKHLAILQLQPLNDQNILTILSDPCLEITEPRKILEMASKHGIAELLRNPETLKLIAEISTQLREWPTTRKDIYELASEKLIMEMNQAYRDYARRRVTYTKEQILGVAGEVCAVLLLAGCHGIALDNNVSNTLFPLLKDCNISDESVANQAIRSRLFKQNGLERMEPCHRSIAEYLAGRWLASQIQENGLPFIRVRPMILGHNNRSFSHLRGLCAWLATYSMKCRHIFIQTDPMALLAYGVPSIMSERERQMLVDGLDSCSFQTLAAIPKSILSLFADKLVIDTSLTVLKKSLYDELNQHRLCCILLFLECAPPRPELKEKLLTIVSDARYLFRIRYQALSTLISYKENSEVLISLLLAIKEHQVQDPDNELMSILLKHLYPNYMEASQLICYLRLPKAIEKIWGDYQRFWQQDVPDLTLDDQLVPTMQALVRHSKGYPQLFKFRWCKVMVNKLLQRTILHAGHKIEPQQLYDWLGLNIISSDPLLFVNTEIISWFQHHQMIYQNLIAWIFERSTTPDNFQKNMYRLRDIQPMRGIGKWYLSKAADVEQIDLAKMCIGRAVNIFFTSGEEALFSDSLERLEAWKETYPDKAEWIEEHLIKWLPGLWSESQTKQINPEPSLGSIYLEKKDAIENGKANVDDMHNLAAIWRGFSTIENANPHENFIQVFEDHNLELLQAVEKGFQKCLFIINLPNESDIIENYFRGISMSLHLPCLVGMKLYYENLQFNLEHLSEKNLRSLIAFLLTSNENPCSFFYFLVDNKPNIVLEIFMIYAKVMMRPIKNRPIKIDKFYFLLCDSKLMPITIIPLLRELPLQTANISSNYLKNLFSLSLILEDREGLQQLVLRKISSEGMDPLQRTYWYVVDMFIKATDNHDALWSHVTDSSTYVELISEFVEANIKYIYDLQPDQLVKLITFFIPYMQTLPINQVSHDSNHHSLLVPRLIAIMSESPNAEFGQALLSLSKLDSMINIKPLLIEKYHEQQQRERDAQFQQLSPAKVALVLANKAPTCTADLWALILDIVDEIIEDIRTENTDSFRAFWDGNHSKHTKRQENYCRDQVLLYLRHKCSSKNIVCEPESDSFNDKRADIKVSYGTLCVPIEIKRDCNDELWTAINEQLIPKYASAKGSVGYGIYLVLWFNDAKNPCKAKPLGSRPPSPQALKELLEVDLTLEQKQRIGVRVIDVSWPETTGKS
jgi:hypothetical protein